MVLFTEQVAFVDAPLHHVAAAHSQRFPSPYSTHVLSSDVISRTLSPTKSTITTTRLILKRGKMPRWAPSAMSRVGTSWVLEDSEVDLEKGDEVRVRSRNIDHKTVMEVCEWQTFKRDQEPGTGQERTKVHTVTRVTSEISFWPVRYRIEKFGISRVPKSGEKARAGLSLVLSHLISPATSSKMLDSGPLHPYPFPPLPSPLVLASELLRARFDETRAGELRKLEMELMKDERERQGGEEESRVWRGRWKRGFWRAVKRGREGVCTYTGIGCEKEKKVEV